MLNKHGENFVLLRDTTVEQEGPEGAAGQGGIHRGTLQVGRREEGSPARYTGFHTLQRHNTKNAKKIFPEKELQFPHIQVPVSDLYIPTIGLPILLEENMWTDLENI
jgi:hypothetical protein